MERLQEVVGAVILLAVVIPLRRQRLEQLAGEATAESWDGRRNRAIKRAHSGTPTGQTTTFRLTPCQQAAQTMSPLWTPILSVSVRIRQRLGPGQQGLTMAAPTELLGQLWATALSFQAPSVSLTNSQLRACKVYGIGPRLQPTRSTIITTRWDLLRRLTVSSLSVLCFGLGLLVRHDVCFRGEKNSGLSVLFVIQVILGRLERPTTERRNRSPILPVITSSLQAFWGLGGLDVCLRLGNTRLLTKAPFQPSMETTRLNPHPLPTPTDTSLHSPTTAALNHSLNLNRSLNPTTEQPSLSHSRGLTTELPYLSNPSRNPDNSPTMELLRLSILSRTTELPSLNHSRCLTPSHSQDMVSSTSSASPALKKGRRTLQERSSP